MFRISMKKILFTLFFIIISTKTFASNSLSNVVVDGAFYDWNVYFIDDLSGEKNAI